MKIGLLLADDHKIVRASLRSFLEDEPDMEVVADTLDIAQARKDA